jgi:dihydrofolate reductase
MEGPENWQFPYMGEDVAAYIQTDIHSLDAMMLGRVTYEIFAGSWPHQTNNEFGIADKLNNTRKYVVSTTLKKADWNNSVIINGNVLDDIAQLKQTEGGDIGITGSCTLVQSLAKADLIDEYRLMVYPIVLGRGQRLFDAGMDLKLKLVDSKAFSTGVVILTYQPDRSR